MKFPMNAFSNTIETLLRADAYRVTKYLSETAVVRATRRHRLDRRAKRTELVVTFGQPNYAEREFIKAAKKAGEPFPIRKVQIKLPKKAKRH